VPDVVGKTVRSAVELFARAGILPELKGEGPRVVRQEPAPGTPWPDEKDAAGKKVQYILWLSEQ
jgi:cell division protein FtsI (penicillin-binding protein 3)